MDQFILELLDSRERRYEKQIQLINKYKKPIISFMLNVPGREKKNEKIKALHRQAIELIESLLKEKILYSEINLEETGIYYLASVYMDAKTLKEKMIDLENSHLGRLFDIDVFDENERQITRSGLGLAPRKCLLCNNIARICIKEEKHSSEELVDEFNSILDEYVKK